MTCRPHINTTNPMGKPGANAGPKSHIDTANPERKVGRERGADVPHRHPEPDGHVNTVWGP